MLDGEARLSSNFHLRYDFMLTLLQSTPPLMLLATASLSLMKRLGSQFTSSKPISTLSVVNVWMTDMSETVTPMKKIVARSTQST